VYRMAFGQPRQEDLVDYLLSRMEPDEASERLRGLQIDLSLRALRRSPTYPPSHLG